MISKRQSEILQSLIKEYIDSAEPVSSELLKKRSGLEVSPATIRNELQELTVQGYIMQPHTSAGRIPTEKGYKFFINVTFSGSVEKFPDFILREVQETKEKIEKELAMARALAKSLEQLHEMLNLTHHIQEDSLFDMLRIVGPSRTTYERNIDLMKEVLREFESFL